MVAEPIVSVDNQACGCSLAKISMVAEHSRCKTIVLQSCSLAKISMVAELWVRVCSSPSRCSLAKISMVAEHC